MQRFLNAVRGLIYPAAVVLLVCAAYLIVTSVYISDGSGRILAVYNGDSAIQTCDDLTPNKENESEEALAGFCKAKASESGPELEFVNIHSEGGDADSDSSSAIYQQLASKVARGSVLGVISFLTSPDSPPVIRFCRTMQIPLLITIAANDDLMARSEDTRGIVFRMIPKNGEQALDIADWLRARTNSSPGLRVAVFHEPNTFGEFLHRELSHELKREIRKEQVFIYDFEVRDQLEFADLMPQLWCTKIDTVAYLGFAPRALDLLNQLGSFKADPDQVPCPADNRPRSFKNLTVLLSSGAYLDDLKNHQKYTFQFNVSAMLPLNPCRRELGNRAAPDEDETTDAFEYGYDSFQVLPRLAKQGFRVPSSERIHNSKTGHDFRFDPDGELTSLAEENKYHPYPLPCPAEHI